MTIRQLVDRFLAWPVPESVRPDNLDADQRMRPGSSGTNLLSADEAKQMFEYCLDGLLVSENEVERVRAALADVFKMMNEGLLVRDISQDHSPDWAIRSMMFVERLKRAADALDSEEESKSPVPI